MPLFGPPDVSKLIDKRDLKRLAKTLADEDPARREQAAQGLIQLADPSAVPPVVDAVIDDQRDEVIGAGVRVLQAIGDRAVPTLEAGLRSGPPKKRAAYAALLGRMGPAYGLQPLLETSRDQNPAMRAIAAMGLGLLSAPEAVARLEEMLAADTDVEARGYAGFAMAEHKLPGAYDALLALTGSDDPASRAIGAMNLGVLGDRRAAEVVRRLAGDDPDARVRDTAAKALPSLEA